MNALKITLLVSLLALVISSSAQSPVIVELFTSQGCSSCPAADANLTRLMQLAAHENETVIGLSFHVDYWNYLGWKDPYSSKAFTARQRAYAEKLETSSVYTPQMVVNGTQEFVGSDQQKAKAVIAKAQAQKQNVRLTIDAVTSSGGKLQIAYSISPGNDDADIWLAVVERHVKNYVPRGENSGRSLSHDNVVKYFSDKPLSAHQHTTSVPWPEGNAENMAVIMFVQNDLGAIQAAAIQAAPLQ